MIKRAKRKKVDRHEMQELYVEGIACVAREDMKEAIEKFTAVINYTGQRELNGEQLVKHAYYHRAYCYEKVGDRANAKADAKLGEKPKRE